MSDRWWVLAGEQDAEAAAVEVVTRGRWGRREAETDRRMLWWIGRFRFVTAAELSLRFAISEQRINTRIRRFLREGLVAVHREHVSQSRAVYLTSRGASVIGQPRRKAPRADTQRRHELAVVRLAVELELDPPAPRARVFTERECRQAERRGDERWSVDVYDDGRMRHRWPDLVVDLGGRRRALEIELAVKHTSRLRNIVESYAGDAVFEEVLWLVEQPALRRRIETLIEEVTGPRRSAHDLFPNLARAAVEQRVAHWYAS